MRVSKFSKNQVINTLCVTGILFGKIFSLPNIEKNDIQPTLDKNPQTSFLVVMSQNFYS
jgi:hypothetical protein